MGHLYNGPGTSEDQKNADILLQLNICFTGNTISYLSSSDITINLEEWVWHEEVINGEKHCIVTDRINTTRIDP